MSKDKKTEEMSCDVQSLSDEEFELVLKERFKAYEHEYDKVKKVLEKITDSYVCDCEKNYGKTCKYPEKYRNGGCK